MSSFRRRLMMAAFAGGIPGPSIPYQRIAYLESNKTQTIDTGLQLSVPQSMKILIDFEKCSDTGLRNLFGSRDGNGFNLYFQTDATFGLFLCGGYVARGIQIASYDRGVLEWYVPSGDNAGYATYKGVNYSVSARSHNVVGSTYYLFTQAQGANNAPDTGRMCAARIYSCKIYIGDVLVRDFYPVRDGLVGYLYDAVSEQLFGEYGAGDPFILGPDI